jgi:hypothetical protein
MRDDDRPVPAWLHLVPEIGDVPTAGTPADPGALGATVRGEACRTRAGLFNEWARALAFPDYFGHNWDAFAECLTDVVWPEVSDPDRPAAEPGPLTVTVLHAEYLLLDAPPAQLATFLAVVDDVATGRTVGTPGPRWPSDAPRLRLALRYRADAGHHLPRRLRTARRA